MTRNFPRAVVFVACTLSLLASTGCKNGSGSNSDGNQGCEDHGCRLTASDAESSDFLGGAVGLDEEVIAVGAVGDEVGDTRNGAVYVYLYEAEDAVQAQRLTASDGEADDSFGNAVAVDSDVIVVGAVYHDGGAGARSGAVYVYRLDVDGSGEWEEEQKLTAPDGAAGDFFGTAVAISGDELVVGSWGDLNGSGSGSAYVFRFNGTDWNEVQNLTGSVATIGFGRSVDIDGDALVIGDHGIAARGDVPGRSGAAYVFSNTLGVWSEDIRITTPNGAKADHVGAAVAIDDDIVVVGALGKDGSRNDTGVVYAFNDTPETTSYACAVQSGTGNVVCWGNDSDGQATPPDSVNGTTGTASQVAAGTHHSCAIQSGSAVVICWGDDTEGQSTPPDSVNGEDGTASDIAVGDSFSCAVQVENQIVVCWGNSTYGKTTPPADLLAATGVDLASDVETSSDHACGLQVATGEAHCWGNNSFGQATAPNLVNGTSGSALDIAVGSRHSCARRQTSDTVICWGSDIAGQSSPPASVTGGTGTADFVAAGDSHSCAIQTGTGNVICWGADNEGQATPPGSVDGTTGTATLASAGKRYSLSGATTLAPSDGHTGDFFGAAVDIDGDALVVGAKYDSPHGSRSGSAYLYRLESGDWEEDQQLTPRDSDIDEHFGTSVAIDGDLTVGGANGPGIDGTAPGFAAVFEQ